MHKILHVISDLHLGGAQASGREPGFQMCPPQTHALLARFIDGLPSSTEDCDSILVIAGDVVDFLAEVPHQAFTANPADACAKLQRIFNSTRIIWDALHRFATERNGVLIIMLGNHDIELSLPGVRQMFVERLGGNRTSLIYDNEACVIGPVLIEHGNRFDAWNAVPHGALRRVRSQLSRRLPVFPEFPALPGSRMVIEVINPLKSAYPFIDLLKPETAVALPIAAALGAVGLNETWKAYGNFSDTWSIDYDEATGEPKDPNLIAGERNPDQDLWDVAQDIGCWADLRPVDAVKDAFQNACEAARQSLRAARLSALFTAFRELTKLKRLHSEAFAVDKESPTYLLPVRRSLDAGFEVVVYGHTHLPKHVEFAPRAQGRKAHYFNTGTWADLMCVPEGIWHEDEKEGRALFNRFCNDLGEANLAHWRRSMPTYACIEIDGDHVQDACLRFADDGTNVTTAGVWHRLRAGAHHE